MNGGEGMGEIRANAQQLGIPEEGEWLIREIEPLKKLFSHNPEKVEGFLGKITIERNAQIVKKSYFIPFSKRATVQIEINRISENDVIELPSTPY